MEQHPTDRADLTADCIRLAYAGRLPVTFQWLLHQDMTRAIQAGSRALVYCVQAAAWARLSGFADAQVISVQDPVLLQALIPHLQAAADLAPEGRPCCDFQRSRRRPPTADRVGCGSFLSAPDGLVLFLEHGGRAQDLSHPRCSLGAAWRRLRAPVRVPDPRACDPMANFHTHLKVGIFVSGGAVLALDGAGLVGPDQTLVLFGLGVLGSLLPDIDANASSPVRAIFGLLGAALAFGWTLPLVGRYPPLELALVWGGLFVGTRFLLLLAFARYTVHRGIWHSWLAVAFAALATVNLAHWVLHQASRPAWVAGLTLGLGYLTHLVLDEIYSVDIFNSRVRRSFGTALKPFSLADPASSLWMAAAVGLLAWLAPAADFVHVPVRAEWAAWADQALVRLGACCATSIEMMRVWLK
jgi:hypothetical protein